MSATQWIAKIEQKNGNDVLYIANGNIISGTVAKERKSIVEVLESSGVDGRRFRKIYAQKDPFVLNCFIPCSEFEKIEKQLTEMIGRVVTLTLKVIDKEIVYNNATVIDFRPTARLGKMTGFGAETSSPYTLRFTITIEAPNE